jgi:hypothetical protein
MIGKSGVVVVLAACLSTAGGAAAQTTGSPEELARQVEARFDVLPVSGGVVLRPKSSTASVRSVELAGGTIAIDGATVTGAELRERLGPDADLIIRLSYLDEAVRRRIFTVPPAPVPSQPEIAPVIPPPPPPPPPPSAEPGRERRRTSERIRLGGSVSVDEDEIVDGDVVAIGGSARIRGEVRGEVVAVGGSVELGPGASVSRDVVVVGGTLRRDPTAQIGGEIHEVGIGAVDMAGWRWVRAPMEGWWWNRTFGSAFAMFSTLTRVAILCLLATLVVMLGREHVERIGVRAAEEPLKAGAVGVLSQLLFVPILVITIIILVLTIIGIPLLVLVPFLILGLGLVALVGFTSVGNYLGHVFSRRMGWAELGPYAATVAGILLIVSPLLLARLLGFAGGLLYPMTFGLRLIATIVEYAAWTIGFGAVALVWYNRGRTPPTVTAAPATP